MIEWLRRLWYAPPMFTRRQHYLFMWGIAYLILGWSVLTPDTPPSVTEQAVNRVLPPPFYGVALVASGAAALLASWRIGLMPQAFAGLAIMFLLRAIGHGYSAYVTDTWGAQLPAIVLWLALMRLHILVSGWSNEIIPRVTASNVDEQVVTAMSDALIQLNEENERLKARLAKR